MGKADNVNISAVTLPLCSVASLLVGAPAGAGATLPYPDVCVLWQATKVRRAAMDADARKLKRRKAHSAPGSVEDKPERQKRIVAELE